MNNFFREIIMMHFDDKPYLAQKIKYHRKKMKLTQSELARLVNLTEQHISRIESGCYIPSLKSFFQLIEVLKIDLREFGFNASACTDERKNLLIQAIINADENEIVLYQKVIDGIHSGLEQLGNKV